jgi:hypothetical protein
MKQSLTPEEFVLTAIQKLQGKSPKFPTGIHVVYSGFNAAFKTMFPALDPVTFTNGMAKEGKIELRICRGGAVIYRTGEAPERKATAASKALSTILGFDPAEYGFDGENVR